MGTNPSVEIAARMPWTKARDDSWWVVSGRVSPKHSFTDCIARVLPGHITGHDIPMFEVMIYTQSNIVPASSIESAKELMFVHVDDPFEAYYEDDQQIIDRAQVEGI